MARFFKTDGTGLLTLSGDTFPIRERIKAAGGRWDGRRKCWLLKSSPESLVVVQALGFSSLDGPETATLVTTTNVTTATAEAADGSTLAVSLVETTTESLVRVWSVNDFVGYLSALLARHLDFEFWLCGEISSLKSSNGHIYFDLAERTDSDARLSAGKASAVPCILWAGKARNLAERHGELPLAEGLKIKVLVHCEFRREYTRLNVIVDDIDVRYTVGELALTRQNIVRELRRRGLYDLNKRTSLAPFALRIALLTAASSRAASDFLDELKLSGLAFSVVLFDVNMQGEQTSPNVCTALQSISQTSGRFDCVVITRGGGSRLDLRWFDDLEISKAIAHCPLPVVTAIGHFEDVSVADEVAFRAEKTPTGAARYLTSRVAETLDAIFARAEQAGVRAQRRLAQEATRLARYEEALRSAVRRRLEHEKSCLASCAQTVRILRLSLHKTLHRGYALLRTGPEGPLLAARHFLPERDGDGTSGNPEFPRKLTIELLDAESRTRVHLEADVAAVETHAEDPHHGK